MTKEPLGKIVPAHKSVAQPETAASSLRPGLRREKLLKGQTPYKRGPTAAKL